MREEPQRRERRTAEGAEDAEKEDLLGEGQ
jgi:hypothetical protein